MKTGAYRCLIEATCTQLATVQIADQAGAHTRACFPHGYQLLKALDGGKVVWSKTRVNEPGRVALEMTEAR